MCSYISSNTNIVRNFQIRLRNIKYSSKLPKNIEDVTNLFSSGRKKTPVAKYYKNKLVCTYNSISEAEELNNLPYGAISGSCLNNCKADVFNFKFIK